MEEILIHRNMIKRRARYLSRMRARLVIRRSWVRGSGPATFFRWDWSWNLFYGHSLPSADSRREVVSYLQKNVHWVLVNRLVGLSLGILLCALKNVNSTLYRDISTFFIKSTFSQRFLFFLPTTYRLQPVDLTVFLNIMDSTVCISHTIILRYMNFLWYHETVLKICHSYNG